MRKSTILGIFVIAGMLFCSVSFAQATTPVKKKVQNVAYCADIGKNLEKRITNFQNKKSKHIEQYQKTQKRVTVLVDRLEAEGKDVSQLRVDLVNFDQLIAQFDVDYAAYIIGLQSTKEFTCGKSEGEFKAKLTIVRAQLKKVRDDSVTIRTYWAKTIKPKLLELKTDVETDTAIEDEPLIGIEGGAE
jgi:hypothetical protein